MSRNLTSALKRTAFLIKRLNVHQQFVPHRCTTGAIITPKFPELREINADNRERKNFKEFSKGFVYGENEAIDVLTKLLAISDKTVTAMVKQYPCFALVPRNTIEENFEYLRGMGMFKSTIIYNVYLLSDKTCDLIRKMKYIKMLGIDVNECVTLFHLSADHVVRFVHLTNQDVTILPHSNRILYLADRFKQDVPSICRYLIYNQQIMFSPPPKLLSITEFLLESEIKPEHIMNDPVVYNYDFAVIKDRVTIARNSGIKPLKPWVVRCTDYIWTRALLKHSEKRDWLYPHNGVREFLCDKFGCSLQEVDILLFKRPSIRTITMKKLAFNIALLCEAGYTITDVQRAPQILHRKNETLMRYLDIWRKSGAAKMQLFAFCLSEKNFVQVIQERYLQRDIKST